MIYFQIGFWIAVVLGTIFLALPTSARFRELIDDQFPYSSFTSLNEVFENKEEEVPARYISLVGMYGIWVFMSFWAWCAVFFLWPLLLPLGIMAIVMFRKYLKEKSLKNQGR